MYWTQAGRATCMPRLPAATNTRCRACLSESEMDKKKPIFGIVMVFFLGILCGLLATHLFYSCRFDSFMHGRGENREEMLVNRLEGKLKLDERQVAQVRAIVHETHQGIEALRAQIRPQIEALIGKSQAR